MFHSVGETNGSRQEPGRRDRTASSAPRGDSRPRLLILTADFPPARGGVQVLMHRLAAGMEAFETKVVALDAPGAGSFDSTSGLSTHRVRAAGSSRAGRLGPLNAGALLEAARFRPTLTLSAHIVTSPAAAGIRRLFGARTVQYFYAKEIADKPRLAAFAARQAHGAIAISNYTSELLASAGALGRNTHVIPPGVDIPGDPRPLVAEHPTFVTIARLGDRYKGHDVLVQALAGIRERVPDVEWVVIGDGPLRPELEALARSRGVAEAVRFLGAVSDEERDSWLRRADLLAMPSRLPGPGQAGDGFGIVYLEAGTYGKPVVAGNVGGPLDAVLDGETGLLVDPADPAEVASAIERLFNDKELALRLGRAGALRAQSFAWPLIVERVQALLLEQLAAPGSRGEMKGAAAEAGV
jgi:phosphatidylinositol alpha-1,6-mannosyltransferase